MRARRFVGVGVLVAVLAGGAGRRARAEDPDALASERFRLDALRAPPATGVVRATWVATDPAFHDAWAEEGAGDGKLLELEGPPFEAVALGSDAVAELVRRLVPESSGASWASRATDDGVDVWSTKEGLAHAGAAVRYVEAALAPRLEVRATLVAGTGDGARLVATGAARVLPRRWTPLWLKTTTRRAVAAYDIEIAQESTAYQPVVVSLPEGEELHVRWSPGERVTVLEAFAGTTEHLTPTRVDLSALRAVPESNAMATVEQPRTAARRALSAVAVGAAAGGVATWAWDGPGGPLTLTVTVGPAPTAPADMELPTGAFGVVRAAAAYGSLDGEGRAGRLDDAIQRYQAGSTSARGAASPEAFAQGFLLCEGTRGQLERLRAQAVVDEAALLGASVTVRCVAADAAVLREDALAGRVVVGALLDPAVAAAYLKAPVLAAATTPLLADVPASVRAGQAVVGFGSLDVEVAQQSGGIDPVTATAFDGFAGRVTLRRAGDGVRVVVAGTYGWADPAATTAECAFRLPLSMAAPGETPAGLERLDNPAVRRATVPLLGQGQATVEAEVGFAAGDLGAGRVGVLAVATRRAPGGGPTTPVVVLVSVAR